MGPAVIDVPLAQLFGYSTDNAHKRKASTTEYKTHTTAMPDQQAELVEFQRRAEESNVSCLSWRSVARALGEAHG